MPIYEYICEACGQRFEQLIANMNQKNAPSCPACKGKTRRQISVFSAHANPHAGACGLPENACQMNPGGCCGDSCPHSH
jgi:putative FmdB family regulatory protein